ncbi:MAG: ABC transporter permease [bacterium]
MGVLEILLSSFESLKVNRVRSSLTMTGIVVGIAAIIATISMGDGMKVQLSKDVANFGRNAIFVYGERDPKTGRWPKPFDMDDVRLISAIDGVERITISKWMGSVTLQYGSKVWRATVEGVTPEYLTIRNREVEEGRFISAFDIRNSSKVCVITEGVEESLFPAGDYLGKEIALRGRIFKVVGKVKPFTLQSLFGQWFNEKENHVFIPATTAMNMDETEFFGGIFLQYSDSLLQRENLLREIMEWIDRLLTGRIGEEPKEVLEIKERIERILDLRKGPGNLYIVNSLDDYVRDIRRTLFMVAVVLSGIAALSLLVGGIGVMNIMAVSVTERTREIGIRKAVGARNRDVLWQFLAEAVALCLVGGAVGIVLGAVVARAVSIIAGMPTLISPWAILLGFLFTSSVGVIFGIHPAYRASRMDPVEALRYE